MKTIFFCSDYQGEKKSEKFLNTRSGSEESLSENIVKTTIFFTENTVYIQKEKDFFR